MKLEVGLVLPSAWAMIKQKFWVLLGMWAVFFGIQMVFQTVMGAFMGGSMMALGALGPGLDSPDALLGGAGVGAFLLLLVFMAGYLLIMLASQAAMAILGSPLNRDSFGDALANGFKSALTLLGTTLLLMILYFVFGIAYTLFAAALTILGDVGAIIAALLLLPAMIYFAMRFAVLVPVIGVEKVFNPLTAIKRTWEVTSGNVLGIFLVTLVVIVAALVLLGVPFFVMFGAVGAIGLSGSDPGAGMGVAAMGAAFIGLLLFFPLYIIFSIVSVVINSCLHAELTDSEAEDLEATFS